VICSVVVSTAELWVTVCVVAPFRYALPEVNKEPVATKLPCTDGDTAVGLSSVGLVFRTTEPVPVEVVTPVPPLRTGRTPVTLVESTP
jgi:hypothetical protein